MKCHSCDNTKPLKEKITTYKYADSGLDNVTLHGVGYSKCDKCAEEYYNIPNLEDLHNKLAQALIRKKGMLSGKELRYLRTHMGYSGGVFAKLIDVNPATLSRYENDKLAITPQLNLLIRSLVEGRLPDRSYDLHDHILQETGKDFKRIDMSPSNKGWELQLAS